MKKAYWVVGILVGVVIAGLLLLSFGNPQASKYVYMFQAYVWPAEKNEKASHHALVFAKMDKNYSGVRFDWHPNGALFMERQYKNGKQHGFSRTWLKNGELKFECSYREGQLHGRTRLWDENMQLSSISAYENGKMSYYKMYKDGHIQLEQNYVNGAFDGFLRRWHENGQLKHEVKYKNDKCYGILRQWETDGQLKRLINYKDVGADVIYSPDINIDEREKFKNILKLEDMK